MPVISKFALCSGFAFVFLHYASTAFSQEFAPKERYLVDSLDLSVVLPDELSLIDSALDIFHSAKSDTTRVQAIGLIVEGIWNDAVWPKYNEWVYDFTEDRLANTQPPAVAKILKKAMATSLGNFGYLDSSHGDLTTALDNYEKGLLIMRQLNDKEGIAAILNNIAAIYTSQGNQVKALEYNLESLVLKEAERDSFGIAISLNNIASIYQDLGDTTEAMAYYTRSLEMREAIKDQKGIANSLNNIGLIYVERSDYKKALQSYERCFEIYDSIGYQYGAIMALNNIGRVYSRLGEDDNALHYYELALKRAEKIADKELESLSLNNIGWLHFMRSNFQLAKKFGTRSYDLGKELGYPYYIESSAGLLKSVYEKLGDYKNAYYYFTEEMTMRDSVRNEETYKLSQKHQARYEYEKQHAADSIQFVNEQIINKEKIERQNAEIIAKENEQLALYGGLFLVVVFSGITYNRFSKTRKQKSVIEIQKREVEEQKDVIEEKHREITDSINYAERIQRAMMASNQMLSENLSAYFIYFNPKEAVSGDFYWAAKLPDGNFCLAVADSTGHGVPGAIMSILNIASLDKAVTKGISNPAEILNETRALIIESLRNDGSSDGGKDGMDCSLVSFDLKTNSLNFALANNPLWICRNNEMIEFAPDKMPVGRHTNQDKSFTRQSFVAERGDMIYLFTDGYADQFGGPKGKKFKYASLKSLLPAIAHLPPAIQQQKLHEAFNSWKADLEQVDDVCIIGVRM